jgi:hypothetical protein
MSNDGYSFATRTSCFPARRRLDRRLEFPSPPDPIHLLSNDVPDAVPYVLYAGPDVAPCVLYVAADAAPSQRSGPQRLIPLIAWRALPGLTPPPAPVEKDSFDETFHSCQNSRIWGAFNTRTVQVPDVDLPQHRRKRPLGWGHPGLELTCAKSINARRLIAIEMSIYTSPARRVVAPQEPRQGGGTAQCPLRLITSSLSGPRRQKGAFTAGKAISANDCEGTVPPSRVQDERQ